MEDDRELQKLKELVPYKVLAPTPNEIIDYITNLQEENNNLKQIMLEKQFPDLNAVQVQIKTDKYRIDKAIEIYENRNTCKYKKKRFMEGKNTGTLMYEILKGEDNGNK